MEELEAQKIFLDNIYLDPNNPRFWTERHGRMISDEKIPESNTQKLTKERMNSPQYAVADLRNSILRNGFLGLDRVVVRPIQGYGEKYVVVEGNRRITALKILKEQILEESIDEDGINEEQLYALSKSIDEIEVLVYKGSERDISWLLQGIRHISGIKDWEPAQRARLVAQQLEQVSGEAKKTNFTTVGQMFGLNAKQVGRLYRAYKALEQMRRDDEYGAKAENSHFSLLEEAHKNLAVRNWLDWNDAEYEFKNENNLKLFYSWILKDDENENKERISNPRHIQALSTLIEKKRDDLIGEVDRHELAIDAAKVQAVETPIIGYDWEKELEKARKSISSIPFEVLDQKPQGLKEALEDLGTLISRVINKNF